MARCRVEPTLWKQRRAYRVSNDVVELTVLLGGGHIADLRLCGSGVNALWEAPWDTIEPHQFSSEEHASLYGEPTVGRMLSGYTGHAVALGYFGMPSKDDAARGLPLHGEAVTSEWRVAGENVTADSAGLTLEVELPLLQLHFRRSLTVAAGHSFVEVVETLTNLHHEPRFVQWVEHAAFGEPLLARGEAQLSLSADRGMTWPLGYEGHGLLPDNREFAWPKLDAFDLSEPFVRDGTGFVAAVRVAPSTSAFAVVNNFELKIAAGYVFSAEQFPWIALWEENCARDYPPWQGKTRVRGVEFGTSPMPLGLEHATRMRSLFDRPTVAKMAAHEALQTSYSMFVTPLPPQWRLVEEGLRLPDGLMLRDSTGEKLLL